jgi:hypothetical protein
MHKKDYEIYKNYLSNIANLHENLKNGGLKLLGK